MPVHGWHKAGINYRRNFASCSLNSRRLSIRAETIGLTGNTARCLINISNRNININNLRNYHFYFGVFVVDSLRPNRNEIYRNFVGKLQPPVIPFMPLLLKDMTFAHEGNKTSLDGLVNFEKMHMMAQTMRTIRFCRSRHLGERRRRFVLCFPFTFRIYLIRF